MRVARTLTLLTLFAGVTTWFATLAALRRRNEQRKNEIEDRTRWEDDGGATTSGPQLPSAASRQ